jgi:hypothetical protein
MFNHYYRNERRDFCEKYDLSIEQVTNNTSHYLRGLTTIDNTEPEHIFLTLRELYENFLPSCMAPSTTSGESPQTERFHPAPLAAGSQN